MASARSRELAVLAGLLWAGLVLWRYEAVDPPVLPTAVLLGAGWIAVLAAGAWGTGMLVWRALGGPRSAPVAAWPAVSALGLGVLASGAWPLSGLGILRTPQLLLLLAAAVAAGVILRPATLPRIDLASGAVLGALAAVTFLIALVESPFYDQVHYHLAMPEQWLLAGRVSWFPRQVYSHLATQMSLLYTFGLAAFGATAAQLQHWFGAALAVAGAGVLGERLRPGAGPVAAVLFAACPSVMVMSTRAAADLGVAAFVAGALVLALGEPWPGRRELGRWALCGLLVGFAVASKYIAGLTGAVPVAAAVLVGGGRRGAGRLIPVAIVTAASLLPVMPWAIQNVRLTGDPFYPYLGSVVRSDQPGSEELARGVGALGAAPDPVQALSLRTFDPRGDAGLIGPLFLLLLPCAVGWLAVARTRPTAALAAAVAVGWLGWALSPQLGRYIVPVLVPFSALAAAGLVHLSSSLKPRLRSAVWVLLALALGWSAQGGLTDVGMRRLAASVGAADPEAPMRDYVSYWPALDLVHRYVPLDETVLLVGEPRSLHLRRRVVVEDAFRTPLLVELAQQRRSAGEMAGALREMGVSWVVVNPHEAARIARMTGRRDFFDPADSADRRLIGTLFRDELQLVGEAGGVRLYHLEGSGDGA